MQKCKQEQGTSLGIYRITFGLLMAFSLLRFLYNGWVEACYLLPKFHFTFQYFHWIKPFDNPVLMYGIIVIAIIAAIFIALGFWYKLSTITFFLIFSYLELIEKSWYLNHYYFVSLIAFLLIFIPANHHLSIQKVSSKNGISSIFRTILKLQISGVYFFAGLAKINSDWIIEAMPLRIWLKAKGDLPIIGDWLTQDWTTYFFSYSGMLYDLFIPFLLWNKHTRPFALFAVLAFHIATSILFPIGLFPLIMIVGSLIFLDDAEWKTILNRFRIDLKSNISNQKKSETSPWIIALFSVHLLIQIALPMRHYFYAENFLWTERHYRFGWNVMLIEKSGYAIFKVKDNDSDKTWTVYPNEYLTDTQEKQMNFQADMIWEFAQFIKTKFHKEDIPNISIYTENWVTFNGRPSQLYLPKTLDLLRISEDEIYDFVLPLR